LHAKTYKVICELCGIIWEAGGEVGAPETEAQIVESTIVTARK